MSGRALPASSEPHGAVRCRTVGVHVVGLGEFGEPAWYHTEIKNMDVKHSLSFHRGRALSSGPLRLPHELSDYKMESGSVMCA